MTFACDACRAGAAGRRFFVLLWSQRPELKLGGVGEHFRIIADFSERVRQPSCELSLEIPVRRNNSPAIYRRSYSDGFLPEFPTPDFRRDTAHLSAALAHCRRALLGSCRPTSMSATNTFVYALMALKRGAAFDAEIGDGTWRLFRKGQSSPIGIKVHYRIVHFIRPCNADANALRRRF